MVLPLAAFLEAKGVNGKGQYRGSGVSDHTFLWLPCSLSLQQLVAAFIG